MDYYTLEHAVMQPRYHVTFSNNGVSLLSNKRIRFSNAPRVKRGVVKGFSKDACRRYRHFLFSVDYTNAVAITLTRPDSFGSDNNVLLLCRGAEFAFSVLTKHQGRLPFVKSLIWRKEVTLNGNPHYHCILLPADGFDPLKAADLLIHSWIDEVCVFASSRSHLEPSVEFSGPLFNEMEDPIRKLLQEELANIPAKMWKAHHDSRRPAIQPLYDNTGFLRYILDHDSKHKAYQCQTTGRAWGVWKRKGLSRAPVDQLPLNDDEFWRIGRVLRKVARYAMPPRKGKTCPFGWRHTPGRRTQGHGSTDYFGRLSNGSLASDVRRYLDLIRNHRCSTWNNKKNVARPAPLWYNGKHENYKE